MNHQDVRALWEVLEARFLGDLSVSRSTMMGLPCLRVRGQFFASFNPGQQALVVKLPRERVLTLVGAGTGVAFAPAGRPFKEWVQIPTPAKSTWIELTDEARSFVCHEEVSK